jgi:VanZ family protein
MSVDCGIVWDGLVFYFQMQRYEYRCTYPVHPFLYSWAAELPTREVHSVHWGIPCDGFLLPWHGASSVCGWRNNLQYEG